MQPFQVEISQGFAWISEILPPRLVYVRHRTPMAFLNVVDPLQVARVLQAHVCYALIEVMYVYLDHIATLDEWGCWESFYGCFSEGNPYNCGRGPIKGTVILTLARKGREMMEAMGVLTSA